MDTGNERHCTGFKWALNLSKLSEPEPEPEHKRRGRALEWHLTVCLLWLCYSIAMALRGVAVAVAVAVALRFKFTHKCGASAGAKKCAQQIELNYAELQESSSSLFYYLNLSSRDANVDGSARRGTTRRHSIPLSRDRQPERMAISSSAAVTIGAEISRERPVRTCCAVRHRHTKPDASRLEGRVCV